MAAAQREGRLDAEIVPLQSKKAVVDKATKAVSYEDVTLSKDEGARADTTLQGLATLKPVREGGFITAGNASQLSDGASACVLVERKLGANEPFASYRILGSERYVRARIFDAQGRTAWTPAVRISGTTGQANTTNRALGQRTPG